MNNGTNKVDLNAAMQWLTPIIIGLATIVALWVSSTATSKANDYTDKIVKSAPFFPESEGAALSERVLGMKETLGARLERIERKLDQALENKQQRMDGGQKL